MRLLLLALLFAPVLLSAQVKNGQKFLKKQRYAEAAEAFAKDTASSDPVARTLAFYGLSQANWKQPDPGKDLNKAYAFLDKTAKSLKKLSAKDKDKAAKAKVDNQILGKDRGAIAQERYAQLEKAPVAREIEVFLAWPDLSAAVKGKAQRLLVKAGGPTKPPVPFEGDKVPFQVDKKAEFEKFVRERSPSPAGWAALNNMLDHYARGGQWDSVATIAERFQSMFPNHGNKVSQIISIARTPGTGILPEKLTDLINAEGNIGWPLPSADKNTLYFSANLRKDCLFPEKEDIFFSKYNGSAWSKPALQGDLSLQGANDRPLGLTSDGMKMLLIRDGLIYESDKGYNSWGSAFEASLFGRAFGWIGSAHSSANDEVMVIEGCLDRTQKFKNTDLFISLRDENRNWQPPFPLEGINTDSMERSPFLHSDMKTLYFSTNGRDGLGGLDIYMCKRLDDTWKNWSPPQYLGKEYNTMGDDWQFKVAADGQKAYFVQKQTDGLTDIVSADLPPSAMPESVATISGTAMDNEQLPLGVEIVVEDPITGGTLARFHSDPADGSYFMTLPKGRDYVVHFTKETYYPSESRISCPQGNDTRDLRLNPIFLTRLAQLADSTKGTILSNLAFDKTTLLQQSMPTVRQLARTLVNTDWVLEIVGHTDNSDKDKASKALSEGRAKAVKEALVGLGIPAERIRCIGMGKTKPAFNVAVPAENAKNNRIEIFFKAK
jgi:outer membrane protein OmpA-like peptidoglycan-associated protein